MLLRGVPPARDAAVLAHSVWVCCPQRSCLCASGTPAAARHTCTWAHTCTLALPGPQAMRS